MIFSSKNIDVNSVVIKIDNNDVNSNNVNYNIELVNNISNVSEKTEVPAIKLLGVFIDANLNFKHHIKQISSKIAKSMYFIHSANFFNSLSPEISLLLHYTLSFTIRVTDMELYSTDKSQSPNYTAKKSK